MTSIGIDLALKKGSVVVRADDGSSSLLSEWDLRRGSKTVQVLATLLQREILRPIEAWTGVTHLPSSAVVVVGIDWDPREGFWGGRKAANKKTFGVGYLYRAFLGYGFRPLLIPPATVRGYFGLSPTEKKEVVHERFLKRGVPAGTPPELLVVGSDNLDALILATVAGELYAIGKSGSSPNS